MLEYNLGKHYECPSFNKLASVYEDMKLAYQMKQKKEARKRRKRKAEDTEKVAIELEDPNPWLPADDKRRKMTGDEIIEKFVDLTERYTLCSDTSNTHAGSALLQMQQGQNKLIGYASKVCVNYGIIELEMMGLLVNMENWKFYLGRKDFDAAVDHRVIPYLMKSKVLPTTERIIRILQRLERFNFHLYYVKGKDMALCDFFSRIKSDDTDPENLFPIVFHPMELELIQ